VTRSITVRRLGADDAGHMRSLVALFPVPEWRGEHVPNIEYYESVLRNPAVYVFCAFDADRPVGFVSAYRFASLTESAELAYIIYVVPTDQARGIGRRLMQSIIAQCRGDGIREAWVGTDLDHYASHKVFLAAGATEPGRAYLQFEFDLGDAVLENT
jgi:GNAT superfamily N-acetyltransferase